MDYFRKVVVRRVAHALWIYVVMIYVFAAIFHAQIAFRELQALEYDLRASNRWRTGPMAMTTEQYEVFIQQKLVEVKRERGYDKPFLLRVHAQAVRALTFDFGTTLMANPVYFNGGQLVMPIVRAYAIPTAVLFGSAFLIQMLLGTLLGLYNASRPGRRLDRVTATLATAATAIAPPVAAMFMVLLLLFVLPVAPRNAWIFWLPTHWSDIGPWASALASHMAAPLMTVVLLTVWQTAHMVRNITAPVMQEDFITAGRGRGLPEKRVLYRHGLRTAAPPIATLLTLGLTNALWGNFMMEPIFQWAGVGTLFLRAIQANEINILMALLVVCTLATHVCVLALDLLYSWLDPRIRVGKSS